MFVAPELEHAYALDFLPQATAQLRGIALVLAVSFSLFAYSDAALLPAGTALTVVWTLRAMVVSLLVLAAVALRGTPSLQRFERLAIAVVYAVTLFNAVLGTTRPASMISYPIISVGLMALLYALYPLPLRRLILPSLILGAGALRWTWKGTEAAAPVAAIALHIIGVGAAGMIVSAQLGRWQRQRFLAMRGQAEALAKLEHALGEVRTLQGILPICSHCKSVRDDTGYWHQVEVYMREHAAARFSHSICPSCLTSHYADELTK